MKASNLTPGAHSLTTTPKRIADFQLIKPCALKVENTGTSTVLIAALAKGAGATLSDIQQAAVCYRLTAGEQVDDLLYGPLFLWAATESSTGSLEIFETSASELPGPAKWAGKRAIDLYPTKCAFQLDPKLACVTYPATDPNPVLASTYVLAADTETVMGVIDSGSRNTLMYQGTAGNRLTLNADALTIIGRNGATQNVPGLTSGSAAGKAVATPTAPFANLVAEGGLTVFAAVKDTYRSGLNVFAFNGSGGTNIYFARNGHGVTAFLGAGKFTDYANAVPPDLYVMAFVYDRAAGTLKVYNGTGLTATHTGIAAFTPATTAFEIGGCPSLGSLSQQGDLLWFSAFEGALPDNVVRAELEALNWQFGVRGNLVVVHANSFGIIAHNTSNTTLEHCFPAKLATYLPDDVTVKSFSSSGTKIAELTTAFPTTVNPWNATSRTNQFYVLHEGTNSLQTAIGADPSTAVASVVADWQANGALASGEGWKPILVGITSRSNAGVATGFNTYAALCNDEARANYRAWGFTGFVDVWNDSVLGGASASANTALFFDGLHPTPAGHNRLAKLIANKIAESWVEAAA